MSVMRVRLSLGCSQLTASLHHTGQAASPLCPHPPCRARGDEETAEHVTLRCPLLAAARYRCHTEFLAAKADPIPAVSRVQSPGAGVTRYEKAARGRVSLDGPACPAYPLARPWPAQFQTASELASRNRERAGAASSLREQKEGDSTDTATTEG